MTTTSPMSPSRPTILSILRLPIELRAQIYEHLTPRQAVSHPFPAVGITAVTHKPPTLNLLLVHPLLTTDILSYFYSHATFKLIFSHAFNFFRVDPELQNLEQCPAVLWLRKIEVVFFCDILLLKGYPSFGLKNFCAEIQRRAKRACEVLSRAGQLSTVVVSWIDTTLTEGWEEKASVLEPLRLLTRTVDGEPRPITFRVGEINGSPDLDRMKFTEAMRKVLGDDARLETGIDETSADAAMKMRLLAFDPKQELRPLPRAAQG